MKGDIFQKGLPCQIFITWYTIQELTGKLDVIRSSCSICLLLNGMPSVENIYALLFIISFGERKPLKDLWLQGVVILVVVCGTVGSEDLDEISNKYLFQQNIK